MTTPAHTGPSVPVARQERAQPRLRWPHPDRLAVALGALWVVGLIVALVVPALIVGPGELTAPPREVWTAFGVTVLGAAIMMLAAALLHRHLRDWSFLVLGGVPAVSTIVGGVILAATKAAG